jgi:hypothetical protein
VIAELCTLNPGNYVVLIPKQYAVLENSDSNWIILRLISIMQMLCVPEPRLPRKLVIPFTCIIQTTTSVPVRFECVKAIVEIPITNTLLLTSALQYLGLFLDDSDANLRYISLNLMTKICQMQPQLIAEHPEFVTACMGNADARERLLALSLLGSAASSKMVAGIDT